MRGQRLSKEAWQCARGREQMQAHPCAGPCSRAEHAAVSTVSKLAPESSAQTAGDTLPPPQAPFRALTSQTPLWVAPAGTCSNMGVG